MEEHICQHCKHTFLRDDETAEWWQGEDFCSLECLAQANAEADKVEAPR